jgi:flagellar FliJ protein
VSFKFRLQRVLDMRSQSEQEAAGRLAHAQSEAEAARLACAALEEVRAAGSVALAGAGVAPTSVAHLRAVGMVLEQLDRHIEVADQAAGVAERQAELSLTEYRDAFRDRRVLDRLRERHLESWTVEAGQRDRAAMDEIALTRFTSSVARTGTGG